MFFSKPPLGTPLDWENPLNDKTVLALAMNEGHGDKLQDLSMNGNHGTLNNFAFPPTVASGWNPGQTGVGLKFNSGNDYIDCGNNPSLDITDAITIGMWINHTVPPDAGRYIIMKNDQNAADAQYGINIYNNAISYYPGGAVTSIADVIPGVWTCVVFTRTRAGIGQFYINGAASGASGACNMPSKTFPLRLGCRWNVGTAPSHLFDGFIDQFRIQSRAWSAKEVRDYAINPWQVYLDEDD